MSNKQITVKLTRTYPNLDGLPVTSSTTKVVDYNGQNEGTIDLPAGTTAAEFDIPFGSVANATYLEVENKSDQEALVKLNGSATLYSVGPDGWLILTEASVPDGTPLTAASLTLEDDTVAAGEIRYRVLGDPV